MRVQSHRLSLDRVQSMRRDGLQVLPQQFAGCAYQDRGTDRYRRLAVWYLT